MIWKKIDTKFYGTKIGLLTCTAVLTRHCEYTLSVNAVQCVWFTINLQWFPGAHQEVVTRELAEHWLVVRTDQENSGSVHHHS